MKLNNSPTFMAWAAAAALVLLTGCPAAPPPSDEPAANEPVTVQPEPAPGAELPSFEAYPAAEVVAGEPAPVNLASHPEAKTFRTRLTAEWDDDTRFAGHYRVVVIGCGTSCQAVWAVDLANGDAHSLFTSSVGTNYRADSRLIVQNDPAYYEDLLGEMPVEEVEKLLETYGPPVYWVESDGVFEPVADLAVRIDPETKRLVTGSPAPSEEG